MKVLGALLVGAVGCMNAQAAEFGFDPYQNILLGNEADTVAVGDVNGDGRDDVAIMTRGDTLDSDLLVFLQTPSGALGTPLTYRLSEHASGQDVVIADMNNDGIADIVVGQELDDAAPGISILLADGRGGFTRRDVAIGHRVASMAIMDVDLDGRPDVIAQSWGYGSTIARGDGEGGVLDLEAFATVGRGLQDAKVVDVTGDGIPDLVLAPDHQGVFAVYPHDGVGGFGEARVYQAPQELYPVNAIAAGDFDRDGRNEIAVAGGQGQWAGLWIYSQEALEAGTAPVMSPTIEDPESVIAVDLDRDGRDDLVVRHNGRRTVGRFMQGEDGLGSELLAEAPSDGFAHALAYGDVNGDGCVDVVGADPYQGLVLLHGNGCGKSRARQDFDGDGKSDVFWRNARTGANVVWQAANHRRQMPITRVSSLDWNVAGTGDFNGDGVADLLWHNDATGASVIWHSGDYATQVAMTRVRNPEWRIVGIGDFNGDGKDDVLWRNGVSGANAIWLSGDFGNQQVITGVANTDWVVAGVGDFDRDGRDDVLWRNVRNGVNAIWKAANYRSQQAMASVTDTTWQVAAIGDFDADGRADVVWRHASRGRNTIWRGADASSQWSMPGMDVRDWSLAATGDYDGDGHDDVMWRHLKTGANRVWTSAISATPKAMTAVTNLDWRALP